jgi:hypothetical protein
VDHFDRFLAEAREEYKQIMAGQIPRSWELCPDHDYMPLIQRLKTRSATLTDIRSAFETTALKAWSSSCVDDVGSFIKRCIAHVEQALCPKT